MKRLAENGQTLLDVSQGDIRITEHGAEGGGLSENESELNKKGYWIKGTTAQYNIIVEKGVTASLTLENIDITCDDKKMDCINVSHANVTVTLIGTNKLLCNSGDQNKGKQGCALAKDGMDGSLTLRCTDSGRKGHKCDDTCGTLSAKGNSSIKHAGAIGSTVRNAGYLGAVDLAELGFSNFTIEGGNIEASGGQHCPGIGSSCITEHYANGQAYTKNIRITGGNVKATGTDYGSGIGSGCGNKVEDVYITGGTVYAKGGKYAPGIGASGFDESYNETGLTQQVEISGGDTVVTAVGDQSTNMPGIGSAKGEDHNTDINAVPETGYQGYIQDGESEDNYVFTDETPFSEKTEIKVGKFFTMVYFGPHRDVNEIESTTKEQIGANHVISKTGGAGFTEEQMKGLTMVIGKQENGSDFPMDRITYTDKSQLDAINKAKISGKTGEFPLTFRTPNETTVTVTVFLKNKGTDAAGIDPERMESTIAADDYTSAAGGDAWTEEDIQKLCDVKGKSESGENYELKEMTSDAKQLANINEKKTAGIGGKFNLTFKSPAGKTVTVEVTLKVYDETSEKNGESIKGQNIITQTGGSAFTEKQLKEFSGTTAWDDKGVLIDREELILSDLSQIQEINRAKTAKRTGDFPLTIETPKGARITIRVYLRDQGTSCQEGEAASSIGADGFTKPTGGKNFTDIEVVELCKALGKDAYGNKEEPKPDAKQLQKINEAKSKYQTGKFPLIFALKDGTKTTVNVILTGVHKVSFDPDGGDYQPEDQIINGGEKASEPREPKRDGYNFAGWYYVDEKGNEEKWDFNTPVNDSMRLRAKWKRESNRSSLEKKDTQNTTPKQNQTSQKWNYSEVTKSGHAAKTGEQSRMPWVLGCVTGAAGIILCALSIKKRR